MKRLFLRALFGVAMLSVLASCGPTGGYQRGLFTGYVVGATEEEIANKIGKPEEVDNSDPKAPRWVYKKKTFDPDNMNQVDARTIVIFRKDEASGKMKGADVIYSSQ
ncbi:MAG: hypothetical protein ABWZ29_03950 [Casimicrobiaceae bacterium]